MTMAVKGRLLEILSRYLSPLNAQGSLTRAAQDAGLILETIATKDVAKLMPRLERRVRIFLDQEQLEHLIADLQSMHAVTPIRKKTKTIEVRAEVDISRLRFAAKALCDETGTRS